jgi:hypothetical protein
MAGLPKRVFAIERRHWLTAKLWTQAVRPRSPFLRIAQVTIEFVEDGGGGFGQRLTPTMIWRPRTILPRATLSL